jgi:hypothetical protein
MPILMTRSRYGDYNGQTHANFFLRNTLSKHIPKRLVPPQAGAGKLPFRASSASSQQDGGQWAVEKDVVAAWVQLMGAEVLGLKEAYVRTCQVGAGFVCSLPPPGSGMRSTVSLSAARGVGVVTSLPCRRIRVLCQPAAVMGG